MKKLEWSISDLVEMAKSRQDNRFDMNMVVSGSRGNGKSTLLYKFFSRFKQFKPKKHLVYSRKEVIKLLESLKYGCIFDDEAITTSYKRNFFEAEQKTLIQMMNMYRDNFNIYASAIPNFYSLDKDFRGLIKIHIHVVRRGLGIVHLSKSSNLYSDDCWDVAYNKKIEERWAKKIQKNPKFFPPYHKLSTFAGYIRFPDITKRQREIYEQLKVEKRKIVYDEEISLENKKDNNMYERLTDRLIEGKITEPMLKEMCLLNNLKYHPTRNKVNAILIDRGMDIRVKNLLLNSEKKNLLLNSEKKIHNSDNLQNKKYLIKQPII